MRSSRLLPLALAAALPACFVFSREPELSGAWAGTMSVDGRSFPVAAQLRQEEGRLQGPVVLAGVNATLTVFLRGGRVSLSGDYEGHGCSGTLIGDGTLEEDATVMTGTLRVDDTCTGSGEGTFTLRRQLASEPALHPLLRVEEYVRFEYWSRFPGGCRTSVDDPTRRMATWHLDVPLPEGGRLALDVMDRNGEPWALLLRRSDADREPIFAAGYEARREAGWTRRGRDGETRTHAWDSEEVAWLGALADAVRKGGCPPGPGAVRGGR